MKTGNFFGETVQFVPNQRGSLVPPIRFGDDFDLDPRVYELRRAGRVLRLERIPMEILLLLIDARDTLVTREQIVERIWGKDVFVETDNSINVAIRKLRTTLGDDPENPRFIRTVTGKGYRFIAPVSIDEPETILAPPAAAPAPSPPPAAARRWVLLLAVLILAGSAGVYLVRSPRTSAVLAPGGRVMLAVLPFENLTGDPGQEYFSDGLTEEMIARLGSLAPERLAVIARTSVMHFKQTREPFQKMASDLGVQYVLEGSVRRDPGRVRIAAQLIRVDDQTHVWARQYDREPSDLLSVQAEIAEAIANEIQITFSEKGKDLAPATLTHADYEAYDAYLEGRHYWNKRTKDGFLRAVQSFERAILKKPDYAQAYAGLADCYALIGSYGYAPQAEVVPKARAAALRALKIDERLAAAHTSLALINEFYDWDWPTAGARYRQALELDPNYVTARHWHAEYLALLGRFDEALAEIERARQLDPLSLIIAADHGAILHFARRYDEAIPQFLAVLAIDPSFGRAHLVCSSYAQAGRFAEASAHIEHWRETERSPWTWAWAAYVHGLAGQPAEAQHALQEMEASNQRFHLDPVSLYTTAYAGMRKRDEAFAWLQRGCAERSFVLTNLKVDPVFDTLRDDPRFMELLRCAHLDR
jgi:TolB-like protein/DNA-binding winged helix-turn-helix (wHTH) protein/Tfp pilus assembly protein PilF